MVKKGFHSREVIPGYVELMYHFRENPYQVDLRFATVKSHESGKQNGIPCSLRISEALIQNSTFSNEHERAAPCTYIQRLVDRSGTDGKCAHRATAKGLG